MILFFDLIAFCTLVMMLYTPFTRYNQLSNRLWNRCVWQPVECSYTRYSRLSNGFDNQFDNRVERTDCSFNMVVKPVVQPALTTGFTTMLNEQPLFVQPVVKPGCTRYSRLSNQSRLTTGWMFVYTIQPVVKPVWQRAWQQAVSCKRGFKFYRIGIAAPLAHYFSSTGQPYNITEIV